MFFSDVCCSANEVQMVMAPRLHFMSGVREERNGRGIKMKETGREKVPRVQKRDFMGRLCSAVVPSGSWPLSSLPSAFITLAIFLQKTVKILIYEFVALQITNLWLLASTQMIWFSDFLETTTITNIIKSQGNVSYTLALGHRDSPVRQLNTQLLKKCHVEFTYFSFPSASHCPSNPTRPEKRLPYWAFPTLL